MSRQQACHSFNSLHRQPLRVGMQTMPTQEVSLGLIQSLNVILCSGTHVRCRPDNMLLHSLELRVLVLNLLPPLDSFAKHEDRCTPKCMLLVSWTR